ncbi:hypothetical protein QJS10_CPB11g02160 [Acorus calamus]|uniref:Uncharacterized protein n=1 Tax=Acorus calamus TaxID=4465 RepID=A0AAV9DSD8_ACOCL|nr:hypothetical protein QJS10_CPB11g02160 [Acorus calamus]
MSVTCSSWTGDKALRELQEAGISLQCFPVLQECASKVLLCKNFPYNSNHHFALSLNVYLLVKAIKAASEADPEVVHLSGMSSITLECKGTSFATYLFLSFILIYLVCYLLQVFSLHSATSFLKMAFMRLITT